MSLWSRLHHVFGEFLHATDDDILRMSNNRSGAIGKWDTVPAAAEAYRGVPFRTEGGAGVSDTFPVCYWDGTAYRTFDVLRAAGAAPLSIVANGMGAEIAVGSIADIYFWQPARITGVALLADVSGSIEFDILKDTYANYPPTGPDSIVASSPPAISSNDQYLDTTLTGWTTDIAAGDTLRVTVESCVVITRCTLSLKLRSDV